MRYAPAMRVIAIVMAVRRGRNRAAQSSDAEQDAVLKTVQTFFDTMSAKDVEGARAILQPQGRFHAMRMRDGKPDVRAFSNEEYFADLQASKQKMRERIWNPEVRVHGLIATFRAPYDFWIDGKFSHCGVDAFDLIKTEDGWKIAGGVYTLESQMRAEPARPAEAVMKSRSPSPHSCCRWPRRPLAQPAADIAISRGSPCRRRSTASWTTKPGRSRRCR